MTSRDADELHALRTRAYGPHADIHDDEDALRRLQQLEAATVQRSADEPDAQVMPDAAASVDPIPADADADADPDLDTDADAALSAIEPPGPATVRRPKRLALWWTASLLVAVVVAVSVTAFVSRRVQADPREVAVLGVDLAYDVPDFYGADAESVGFASFHGLRVISTTIPWMGSVVDRCVSVFDESKVVITSNSITGEMWSGCGAGAFAPTVEIKIGPDMPEELRATLPVGTALQFVLDGSEVIVLSDRGAAERER